jgi:hypothetical protein
MQHIKLFSPFLRLTTTFNLKTKKEKSYFLSNAARFPKGNDFFKRAQASPFCPAKCKV